MTLVDNANSYYLSGSLSVRCPNGLVTSSGDFEQIFYCEEPLVDANGWQKIDEFAFTSYAGTTTIDLCNRN